MTQTSSRLPTSTSLAIALLISTAALNAAAAGPFGSAESVAIPGGGNDSFVQLQQVNGFTGQMAFSFSDGGYTPIGPFNKLVKFRLSVSCPSGYHPDNAGVRIRGADAVNLNLQLLAPGALGPGQTAWQHDYDNEPWKFDAVVATGIGALDDAGNNGPVYVSLDEELDSRTEYYGWCVPDSPLSGETAFYYDSAQEGTDLHSLTRVRYSLQYSAIAGQRQIKTVSPATQPTRLPAQLRHRNRAPSSSSGVATLKPMLKAPGGCPYDCPPPARRLQLQK
mgnify:CR=1 FL=1